MKKTAISVTKAARNFSDCVNRVRYQNAAYVLTKNGAPIAELVPTSERKCTGRDLAAALAKVRLTDEERREWQKDLAAARAMLLEPTDKWE